MPGLVVFGAQWGDEGKGRFVDFCALQADVVIRYQGGNNAGHTVYANGKEYKLHTIPSGIVSEGKPCIIGNGVVVDPASLLEEIAYVEERGSKTHQLFISDRAHVIMPYHRLLDQLSEKQLGDSKIGTTGRGIGPCYADKINRIGIRMCDLIDETVLREKLAIALNEKNTVLTKVYGQEPLDLEPIYQEYREYGQRLKEKVMDTSEMVYQAWKEGKRLLFEGAQGMLLDIDYGTYPYVTSSNPTAASVAVGSGIGPQAVDQVLGVVKAYTTRVGEGPFTTELLDEMGDAIREKGHEYGATTGRPRRCGWLDLVIIKFAVRISGMTGIALSRMDTLGGFETVKACIGYELDGKRIENYPASLKELERMKPVYREMPGWPSEISQIRKFEDLPQTAKDYVHLIEEYAGVPVVMIGVGPNREECILRKENLYQI